MQPAPGQHGYLQQRWTAALAALLLLAACEPQASADISAAAGAKQAASDKAGLSKARVSTQSGEILILEADGSVSTMALDSPGGRDAFAVTEADLAALNANLSLNLSGVVAPARRRGPTAQERALEAFAARTKPALPVWRTGTVVAPEDFIAVRVATLNSAANAGKGTSDLVEVTANLREGVDADIAFSYATCALAGWAKENGGKYGRHIRTLQDTRNGKLLIGAAFTVSESKPMGLRVMETNQTLRECKARGIPAA